ncbi:MAG: hypothetical protein U9P14_00305 [Gemmatimonadota bacterium]|nr:hypothetical protein [Gemmatimonadota bacterium]
MRTVLKITLICLVVFPSAGGLWADSRELESLREELAELRNRRGILLERRQPLEERASLEAGEVARIKQGLDSRDFSPVRKYRLEARLRQSQTLADSLDALSLELSGLESRIIGLRGTGEALCARAVDSLSLLLAKAESVERMRELLDKLRAYRAVRAVFTQTVRQPAQGRALTVSPGADKLARGANLVSISPGDSPEEIREKADFIMDLSEKWQRHISLIGRQIGRLKDESALRRQIGEFAQEISLFDNALTGRRANDRVSATGSDDRDAHKVLDSQWREPQTGPPVFSEPAQSVPGMDLELHDPDKVPVLSEVIGSLDPDDLEIYIRALQSRRDSLEADLDSLRAWERKLRRKSVEIEKEGKD